MLHAVYDFNLLAIIYIYILYYYIKLYIYIYDPHVIRFISMDEYNLVYSK